MSIWKVQKSLGELKAFGKRLEDRQQEYSNGELLMAVWLKIRNKQGQLAPMIPNRAQREFALTCGRKNIILKARQLGMTTYVAARFLRTIMTPGTLSVQVAHDQRSAEQIFRIVHRFLENLPEELRIGGALETSRANVRQIVFPRLEAVSSHEVVDAEEIQGRCRKSDRRSRSVPECLHMGQSSLARKFLML